MGGRIWRIQTSLAALVLTAWCGVVVTAAGAQAGTRAEEDAVKAAFLVNFAKFVQWPQSASGPLLVCVAAEPEFTWQLTRVARANSVEGRELAVRELADADSPADCEMLFVAAARQKHSADMLQRARGPILTVGESVQFMRDGGMVRFFVEDSRLRFQINQKAAEATGLKLSSRLLSLSR